MKEEITKYAKKGLTPSQIGVVLRDSMGVPQVRSITGSKILRILKVSGTLSSIRHTCARMIVGMLVGVASVADDIAFTRVV